MKRIYFLQDYNWELGVVVSEGPKNYKIFSQLAGYRERTLSVSKDRCAFPMEKICVVWETWKGKNGRGAYRVERELYPSRHVEANKVARQHYGAGRVTESHPGVEV